MGGSRILARYVGIHDQDKPHAYVAMPAHAVLIHLPIEACFTPGIKATTPAVQWQGRGVSPEGKDLFSAYARKSAFLLLSGGL